MNKQNRFARNVNNVVDMKNVVDVFTEMRNPSTELSSYLFICC